MSIEQKEIEGLIIGKESKQGTGSRGPWEKVSFKVEKANKTNMSLSIFKNKDTEELIGKYPLGVYAKFTYTDTKDGTFTYHNIVKIEDTIMEEKVPLISDASPETDRQTLIVRQSCLSSALKFWEVKEFRDVTKEQVCTVAEHFEAWVLRDSNQSGN